MRYLSVCSGIEAATVAWHPLGWTPCAFAEIEKFPRAVLAHHYPSVPNLGDMTKFKDWPDVRPSVLVGGTPCQSFSVAGLRKGMADPRGNLALTYLAIADRYRPEWIVWENVPGVLSSSGGRDFGAFLGGLGELGYHGSYRVLDAQYVRVDGFRRAVPQRRRRVFVVGHLGDWRRAAAVLFERESLSWNSAPRRQAGQGFAADVVSSLVSSGRGVERPGETRGQDPVVAVAFGGNDTRGPIDVATACNAHGGPMGRMDFESETFVTTVNFQTRGSNIDFEQGLAATIGSNADRASGGAPCIAFDARQSDVIQYGNMTGPLDTDGHTMAVAFTCSDQANSFAWERDVYPTLDAQIPNDSSNIQKGIRQGWAVRRLTPMECERLQGFPDGYTDVPYRGRAAADGPRYKALGNSMAVNVMRWIGTRIQMVSEMKEAA